MKDNGKGPHVNQAGINAILELYRRVCIMESAFIHDVHPDAHRYNDNYEQRRIALMDVLQLFFDDDPDAQSKARYIQDKTRMEHWTRDDNELGQIRYVRLDDKEG